MFYVLLQNLRVFSRPYNLNIFFYLMLSISTVFQKPVDEAASY